MKMKGLIRLVVVTLFVFFAYGAAAAQEKETSNDTPSKVKVVVTDALEKATDATKVAVEKSAKAVKKFGSNAVEITDNVVGESIKQGRYYTVKTWDGTKWVSKQVFYETKKAVN